ncbi:hypothetical protein [Halobellus rufus]|uniref:hypothetical protein n=1 Tax=Halobellus rufus TaxID=1448860 RepID=UPI000679BC23|nr:hypothetical protein [Halobellus rufus]
MSNASTTPSDDTDSAAPFTTLSRLAYAHVTHSPLHERYMPSGNFEAVGEPGEFGPIDPKTGAEYHALGGLNHQYNRDYKVGSSYPKTVFVYAEDASGESLSHNTLEAILDDRNLWSDALTPVLLPKGIEEDQATWYSAFQFRPPERAPSLRRVKRQLNRVFDDAEIYHEDPFLDARIWHE